MNNQLKDMFDLIEKSRAELDNIEQDLQSNQKDLLKFYKRGSKRAGVRVRRNLKLLMNKAQSIRMDIQRLYKERDLFKGTEFEKDYKRDKPTT